jgi:hypothetical protein
MRKNTHVFLSLLTVLTMLTIPLSAADKVDFRANGKVTTHQYPWGTVCIDGDWNIRVKDIDPNTLLGTVDFNLLYKEMNPSGSVEHFKITNSPGWNMYVDLDPAGAFCGLFGDFSVYQLTVQPDDSQVWVIISSFIGVGSITSEGLTLDDTRLGTPSDWHFIARADYFLIRQAHVVNSSSL